jgi:hypothetical protein
MQEDREHRTRHHVQLPSGRQIEVVYLDSTGHRLTEQQPYAPLPTAGHTHAPASTSEHTPSRASSPTPTPTHAPQHEQLHMCPRCQGELMHPLDWSEESPGRWRISMRCPDCSLLREGVFGQVLVEELDEELDKATGALLSDLKQLTHANMTEEVELFARALELDLIGPSDF